MCVATAPLWHRFPFLSCLRRDYLFGFLYSHLVSSSSEASLSSSYSSTVPHLKSERSAILILSCRAPINVRPFCSSSLVAFWSDSCYPMDDGSSCSKYLLVVSSWSFTLSLKMNWRLLPFFQNIRVLSSFKCFTTRWVVFSCPVESASAFKVSMTCNVCYTMVIMP